MQYYLLTTQHAVCHFLDWLPHESGGWSSHRGSTEESKHRADACSRTDASAASDHSSNLMPCASGSASE
jgi:hypothetical protein